MHREVPLRVSLVYEAGENGENVEVKNQSILKLSNVCASVCVVLSTCVVCSEVCKNYILV